MPAADGVRHARSLQGDDSEGQSTEDEVGHQDVSKEVVELANAEKGEESEAEVEEGEEERNARRKKEKREKKEKRKRREKRRKKKAREKREERCVDSASFLPLLRPLPLLLSFLSQLIDPLTHGNLLQVYLITCSIVK